MFQVMAAGAILIVAVFFLYQSFSVESHRHFTYDTPTSYSVQTPPLDTPWTHSLGSNPWPEYPRPQLQREDWQNLNGIWRYRNASGLNEPPPWNQELPHEVLIPSCLESAISGIQGEYTIFSWFSHNFTAPDRWRDRRVLLNFGAVDYEATVYVSSPMGTIRIMLTLLAQWPTTRDESWRIRFLHLRYH